MSPDTPPPDASRVREITDARTLRAVAHPVRIAIIEEMLLGGAMTATQIGEQIGESPTTCSFHLRQLAKYGFVEEAGGGRGRARPWRLTAVGMSYGSGTKDPEFDIAATALTRLVRERQLARYQNWLATRSSHPARWQEVGQDSQYLLYLTADELEELSGQVNDLLLPRMLDRLTNPASRPAGCAPVEMLVLAYPITMPPDTGPPDTGSPEAGA
jgi:hypothetical protein